MDVMKKVPVREQEPEVRAKNFEEVCLGYNKEEAMEEAERCLNCKNASKAAPFRLIFRDLFPGLKRGILRSLIT